MTKPAADDVAQQFRNAPRLDPAGQPRTNSGIPDQQGGTPVAPGRASPIGGPPTGERIGGFSDSQVPPGKLP
jgi:hypothetical protein